MNLIATLRRVFFALPLFTLICTQALSSDASSTDFRRCVTTTRLPTYPAEARARRLTGSGVALLKIDPRGTVTLVTMIKSTGVAILDDAVLKAYRRWQFIPNTISEAQVPAVFTINGAVDPVHVRPVYVHTIHAKGSTKY